MILDVLLGLAPFAAPATAPPIALGSHDEPASLERRLVVSCERARERYRLPGLAVCVLDAGELVLARGFGFADLEQRIPVRADTVFRIGSITKTFTAALVLARVERGELGLADDATRWLPELPARERLITLEMLLAHTSGLANYSELAAWRRTAQRPIGHAELVAFVAEQPFDFEPGSDWAYSNTGTFLAGWVLERVSGTSFDALVRRELCEPLGLARTATCAEDARDDDVAQGYLRRRGRFQDDAPIEMSHPFASGALCSNAPELARWLRALARGEVIAPVTLARMCAPTQLPDGRRIPYGLGLALGELDGRPTLEHTGDINGFRAQLTYYPDDDLAVCVLANVDNAPVERIERSLAAQVLCLAPRAAPAAGAEQPCSQPLARYAGRYVHAQAAIAVVHGRDGLATLVAGEPPRPLLHVTGDVFERADARGTRIAFELEDGRGARLLWEREDCELLMERER